MIYFKKKYNLREVMQSRFISDMSDNLDMHNYRVVNLGAPINDNDAARKVDLDSVSVTGVLKADGSVPLTGDLDFNNYKGINVADPVNNKDAVNKIYVDSSYNIANTNLSNHTSDTNNPHQVTESQILNGKEALLTDGSRVLSGNLDFNNNTGINVPNPTNDTDVANKQYVDNGDNTVTTNLNNHTNDTNNPHQVSLEQARSISNVLNGDINMNGNIITNLAEPTNDTDAVTKSYVDGLSGGQSVNQWVTKAGMPTARSSLTSSIYNTDIYAICGGYSISHSSFYLSKNEMYDVTSDSWSSKSDAPTARNSLTSSIYNTDIYTIGGNNGTDLSTSEMYDVTSDSWSSKANMPTARRALTSDIYNIDIYAIGGVSGAENTDNTLSTNEIYDVTSDSWSSKTNMLTARRALTSSIYNTDIYAIGGHGGYLTTNEMYNVTSDSWSSKGGMFIGRGRLTSSIYNTDIYAIGGYRADWLSINEVYDITSDSWTFRINMPTERGYLTSSIYNTDIYAIGGHNDSSSRLSTNEMYTV